MNSNQPPTSSFSSSDSVSADPVSRRAYEIWEQEGKPDGCDLQHWLKAEQELSGTQNNPSQAGSRPTVSATSTSNSNGSDTRPLQGTRPGAAAGRDGKQRSTPTPFSGEKSGAGGGRQPAVAARK